MTERSVRELAGEIWVEMGKIDGLDWKLRNVVTDLIMGVLARYNGATIVNDKDLPVRPLPKDRPDEGH
jgi:hypothetical protein